MVVSRESMALVIGTTNAGKVREFERLIARLPPIDIPLKVMSLASFVPIPSVCEDGASYQANAQIKAIAYAKHAGLLTLADDSGLEVDALDGAPGIYSARYAGADSRPEANIARLLAALADVPEERCSARFRCAIALAHPSGETRTAEGTCEGWIVRSPQGAAGFGYDPVFRWEHAATTFAQMSDEAKDAVSHRANALRALWPSVASLAAMPVFEVQRSRS